MRLTDEQRDLAESLLIHADAIVRGPQLRRSDDDALAIGRMAVCQAVPKLTPGRDPRAFVQVSARNAVVQEFRREVRRPDVESHHVPRCPEDDYRRQEDILHGTEAMGLMASILTPRDAEIVRRRVIDGDTVTAIATDLGINRSTVYAAEERGLRVLRRAMES